MVDSRTIRVIPSTVPVRQELEPRETRPFAAPGTTTAEAEEATTILRTVLGLREVSVDSSNRIVIRDTAENLAMSHLLLEKLAKR